MNEIMLYSLFTSIDDQAWSLPTIEALLTLVDNYDSDVKHKEDHTSEEQLEEDAFLSLVMETRVMKKAYEFCSDKGNCFGKRLRNLEFFWYKKSTDYQYHMFLLFQ